MKRVIPPVDKVREVFLSATKQDLNRERRAVRDALRGRHTAVYLQEEWNQSHARVLSACEKFLERSSGFIGIIGYFYGWIPREFVQEFECVCELESSTCDCSITKIETIWARQRWGDVDPPPVFYFLPQPGSPAAKRLEAMAEGFWLEKYPDEEVRKAKKRKQSEFIGQVRDQGRIVQFFSNIPELRERACNIVSLWNEELLERAPNNREVAPSYRIPLEELGRIGREAQLKALDTLLSFQGRQPDAAALCVVAHGPPRSGLLGFLDCLASWSGWELDRKAEPGGPPGDSYDARSLVAWGLRMVVGETAARDSSIDALAGAIYQRLAREPVVLLLQRADNLEGGLPMFHAEFWQPLCAALAARWKKDRLTHCFTMVIATHARLDATATYIKHSGQTDAASDCVQLQPLPPLGKLRAADIENWLAELGVSRRRRGEIATRVVGSGNPLEVYENLQEYGFWREVAEGHPG